MRVVTENCVILLCAYILGLSNFMEKAYIDKYYYVKKIALNHVLDHDNWCWLEYVMESGGE